MINETVVRWIKTRTLAHLYVNGNYSGISVSLNPRHRPTDETLEILKLPPLPK